MRTGSLLATSPSGGQWDQTVAQAWGGRPASGAMAFFRSLWTYDAGAVVLGAQFSSNSLEVRQALLVEELLHIRLAADDHTKLLTRMGLPVEEGLSDADLQKKLHEFLLPCFK